MSKRTLIIAEAGVNHNGSIDLAKRLVDRAAEAGADIVKFQTFKAKNIASKNAEKASYQQATTGNQESQLSMLQKLELKDEHHAELIDYCKNRHIKFLSTPFDSESIYLLKELGITIGKIPSGEITNLPYLEEMAKNFPTIILSTGMSNMIEIKDALDVLLKNGTEKENITVLHCNTEYPTPMSDVNLLAMLTIKNELGVKIGYSDHTDGIEVPIAAIALGAEIIEKHFTLDRNMEGPDHKASLEPQQLKEMVTAIRNIEVALGNGIKVPSASEAKNMAIARKSLIAARSLQQGQIITLEDIKVKRPGTGISPMRINEIAGKELVKPALEDEVLTDEHFA